MVNVKLYPLLWPPAKFESIRQAVVGLGGVQFAPLPPKTAREPAKPTVGYAELNEICAVFKVRIAAAAADSLAAMRERRKLGTAIAAMTRMIATTINSSMRENPLLLRIASP